LPPNPNVHGWDQHPSYLRGKWNLVELNFTAAAPAAVVAAAAPAAVAAVGSAIADSVDADGAGYSTTVSAAATAVAALYTPSFLPPSLPPSLLTELQVGCKAVVMKGKSILLLREGQGSLSPLGWEFTPANRRMVFEIASSSPASYSDGRGTEGTMEEEGGQEGKGEGGWEGEEEEEGEGGVVWRFSGEVRRKPKHWCHVTGTVRVRPSSLPSSLPSSPPSEEQGEKRPQTSSPEKEGTEGGGREEGKDAATARRRPRRAIPSSSPAWPVIAAFKLEKEMTPYQPLSKWEKLLVWARLEAPRFANTKAGRKAEHYLKREGREEGAEEEWNAQALKYKMWRYFDS